jgi:signal transduction histidine kinase
LSAPERIQYAYKFEELDRDWIPMGSRRVIDYGSLPHGRYRFMVRASLEAGQSSESSIALDVRPYFFQSIWFLCLCALSLLGLTYAAYRFRMNVVRARFALVSAERARLAREIHDTLAQGLVGISGQLNAVANSFHGNPGEARRRLDLARRMAQYSLAEAKRSVIDLRAVEPANLDLESALATAANRCAAGNSVTVVTEIQEIPEKLAPDLKQNILRIVEEGVTNAVKHAGASTIRVDLGGGEGYLRLCIRDDGKGFEPARAHSVSEGHFGIVGMQERAERLGGAMTIWSRPGAGTELEVKIPLCPEKAVR